MKTTFTTQHNAASTLNGSHAAHNVYSPLRRLTLLVTLLMTFALGARAQATITEGVYLIKCYTAQDLYLKPVSNDLPDSLSGQVIKRITIQHMDKEVVPVPSRGVYIVNEKKVAVL